MSNNSAENQAIVLILSAAKAQDFSHMKLVDAVDRGGLCKITPESENIFLFAERVFRNNTSEKLLRKIDTNEMVSTLICNLELISQTKQGNSNKRFGKHTWFIPTCSSILLIEIPHC